MEDILKNLSDNRSYRIVSLPNSIKCLLISDKNIDISSFCLNVSVGALEDPLEFQGLAHLLEHFLLTTSDKCPNNDDFSNFLLNNSGSINTGTDLDSASYCFDCNSSVFEQGLEKFLSFFINPKFDISHLEKTIQLVNSEFDINKNNDYYRNLQILRNSSDKKSPFNKFGMGNKTTLKSGQALRDSLVNFYKAFYSHPFKSANLMTAVIYAKEDLNSLESIISKHLSQIIDKSAIKPVYSNPPFNPSNTGKFIKTSTNSEIDELNFLWILDFSRDEKFAKPLNYIWYILNFGGANSLFSFLRNTGLVLDLNVKISHYFENFSLLELRIKLTPEGFNKTQDIINIVFSYIEFMRENSVKREIFEEAQKLAILNFHYTQKTIDFPLMTNYAKKISKIEEKFILIDEFLWENFEEKLIRETIEKIGISNVFIFLNSKKIDKTDKFDPFFGTNYSTHTLKEDFIDKNRFIKEFSQIPSNKFVPKSTKILNNPGLAEFFKVPKKIFAEGNSDVYYKVDNRFKTPFCFARVRLLFAGDGLQNSEKTCIYWQIWKDLIVESLSETVAQILRAHSHFSLNLEEKSLLLSFRAFSNTILAIIQQIVSEITNCDFAGRKTKFEKILNAINYENEKFLDSDPWVVSDHYLRVLLLKKGEIFKRKLAEEGKKLSFEEFLEFTKSLGTSSKITWLIYGNLDKDEAIEIARFFAKSFLQAKITNAAEKITCVKLPPSSSSVMEHIIEKEITKNLNYSCLTAYWQIGSDDPRNRTLAYLITFLISDPIYNALSLAGKLGYSENGYELLKGVLGYKIKLISKNSCSQYLIQRVLEALSKLRETVFSIDSKKFEDLKNLVLLGITSESADFTEEFENDWVQLSRNETEFNRDQLEREALKEISRKDIEDFFEEIFSKNQRILEIHVSNAFFKEQNIFQMEQRLKEEKTLKFKRIELIEGFKQDLEEFPAFY